MGIRLLTILISTIMVFFGSVVLAKEPDTQISKKVIDANCDFSTRLYKQLAAENSGNLFFSPYSIAGALTMAAEGARGETAEQMIKTLGLDFMGLGGGDKERSDAPDLSRVHESMARICDRLTNEDLREISKIRSEIATLKLEMKRLEKEYEALIKQDKWKEANPLMEDINRIAKKINILFTRIDQYEIRVANALWVENSYPLKKAYLQMINRYYQTGGAFQVDFINAFETAREQINLWVEHQTHNRIKNLVPLGGVNALTRLVLTNAVYFKGEWATPFYEGSTESEDFTLADGNKIKVPMMHEYKIESARYGAFNADGSVFPTPEFIDREEPVKRVYPDESGFAVLELPYKGNEIAMVVLAPNRHDGLVTIEKQLSSKKLEQWLNSLETRKTTVFLPKFKLDQDWRLKKILQDLGIVRAFQDPSNANGAQFQGMTVGDDPAQQLYLSEVLHKSFIEVNEKGTEAAAVTAVRALCGAAPRLLIPFVPEFKANNPFIFLIQERSSGLILFMGKLANP
nr:serpin family protein [uncultured Desulfobacter sp.]